MIIVIIEPPEGGLGSFFANPRTCGWGKIGQGLSAPLGIALECNLQEVGVYGGTEEPCTALMRELGRQGDAAIAAQGVLPENELACG